MRYAPEDRESISGKGFHLVEECASVTGVMTQSVVTLARLVDRGDGVGSRKEGRAFVGGDMSPWSIHWLDHCQLLLPWLVVGGASFQASACKSNRKTTEGLLELGSHF